MEGNTSNVGVFCARDVKNSTEDHRYPLEMHFAIQQHSKVFVSTPDLHNIEPQKSSCLLLQTSPLVEAVSAKREMGFAALESCGWTMCTMSGDVVPTTCGTYMFDDKHGTNSNLKEATGKSKTLILHVLWCWLILHVLWWCRQYQR